MIECSRRDAVAEEWVSMPSAFLAAADVELFTDMLSDHQFVGDLQASHDDELLEFINRMERAKAAIAAAQTRAAYSVWEIQRARDAQRGISESISSKSVGAQIALARRESPARGSRHLGFARALEEEMPATSSALTRGDLSEWQATLLVKETAYLTVADRSCIDGSLATRASSMSDRELCAAAAQLAYQLDPQSVVARRSRAERDRRVSVRPAPDCMTQLSALLPVAGGVACEVALKAAAETARAAGDPRSRGQIMADTLIERVTGYQVNKIPIKVIVVEHSSSADAADRPAAIAGFGPISDVVARELIARADSSHARTTVRADGKPATAYASRTFPEGLHELIAALDMRCRTPYCDAPARHADHVFRYSRGGPTSLCNAQGLCEFCNYTKEHPDWHSRASGSPDGFRQTVVTTTASGWTYETRRE